MKEKFSIRCLTSFHLHILAMIFMLCDHLWASFFGNVEILTCIGRIAYPIFAFMIVEGVSHTRNVWKYLLRLLIAALIAEIPFDLFGNGVAIYLYHQNVMWTYILGILGILLIEQSKKIKKPVAKYIVFAITVLFVYVLEFILGVITMVDFNHGGTITVLIFYLFRGDRILTFENNFSPIVKKIITVLNCIAQLLMLYYIYDEYIGGYMYVMHFGSMSFEIVRQEFALLALIPIWLYSGKQGYHEKWFRNFCYLFYPVHLLILYLLMQII